MGILIEIQILILVFILIACKFIEDKKFKKNLLIIDGGLTFIFIVIDFIIYMTKFGRLL